MNLKRYATESFVPNILPFLPSVIEFYFLLITRDNDLW
jgi:hypothetical protein